MIKFLIKFALLLSVTFFLFFQLLLIDIPDISFLETSYPDRSNFMNYDSETVSDHAIDFVPLSKISIHLIKAVLASEDDTFFIHNGFNLKEFIKALHINLKKKRFKRGASTLTQQLARNLFLSPDKTVLRKLREWIITYKLESTLSKNRILELYLNYVQFGPDIYGVSKACAYHFKTTPAKLSSSQAALLAAMLPRPESYGKKPYPQRVYNRQKNILYKMARYDLNLPHDLYANSQRTRPQRTSEISINEKSPTNFKGEYKEFDDNFDPDMFLDEED